MKGTALVLGDYVQTIAVVRSLARAGARVIVGRHDRTPYSALSRHAHATWTHPDPRDRHAYMRALRAFVADTPPLACVFPVGETDIAAVAGAYDELAGCVTIAMPAPATVAACLDKPTACSIAAAAGVPVPATASTANFADLQRRAASLGGRFVVKCPDSFRALGERKALICDDVAALGAWRERLDDAGWPLVVQAYAPGERRNCHFAAVRGRLVAYFEDRTLRTDRPDGTGYAIAGESVPPSAALRGYCDALAARLAYHGVGCAQFHVDAAGDARFLELNPRLDATCELPQRLGVDFPLIAVQCARGDAVPAAPARYPAGKRFHWLLGDLRGVVGGARRGRVPPAAVLRGLGTLAASHFDADCRLTGSWRDPLPTLYFYMREIASARPRVPGAKRLGKNP